MIHSRIPSLRAAAIRALPIPFWDQLSAVEALQFGITTSGVQGGFSPKEAEQGIALLRESSESLVAPAGTFTGDHADVTGDSFPVGEASWITQEDFGGERSDRADAGMSHESARMWSLLSLLLDLMIETVDGMLKLWIQRKQAIALSSGIWGQRQGAESVLASWGPKGAAAAQTVTQGQRLQTELHASSDEYELMPVSQENLQVALLAGGHPDRGKAFFRQQRENQASVSPIVLLLARLGGADLRGMTDSAVDLEFLHEPQKPVHRSGGFEAHQRGSW